MAQMGVGTWALCRLEELWPFLLWPADLGWLCKMCHRPGDSFQGALAQSPRV